MSPVDPIQLILEEVTATRAELREHGERLATIEAKISFVFDNSGTDGALTKFNKRIVALEKARWKEAGYLGGIMIILQPVILYLARKIGF